MKIKLKKGLKKVLSVAVAGLLFMQPMVAYGTEKEEESINNDAVESTLEVNNEEVDLGMYLNFKVKSYLYEMGEKDIYKKHNLTQSDLESIYKLDIDMNKVQDFDLEDLCLFKNLLQVSVKNGHSIQMQDFEGINSVRLVNCKVDSFNDFDKDTESLYMDCCDLSDVKDTQDLQNSDLEILSMTNSILNKDIVDDIPDKSLNTLNLLGTNTRLDDIKEYKNLEKYYGDVSEEMAEDIKEMDNINTIGLGKGTEIDKETVFDLSEEGLNIKFSDKLMHKEEYKNIYASSKDTIIEFEDEKLRTAVLNELDKNDIITKNDLSNLEYITLDLSKNINLEELSMVDNFINLEICNTDIKDLEILKDIYYYELTLVDCKVDSIKGIKDLEVIELIDCDLSEYSNNIEDKVQVSEIVTEDSKLNKEFMNSFEKEDVENIEIDVENATEELLGDFENLDYVVLYSSDDNYNKVKYVPNCEHLRVYDASIDCNVLNNNSELKECVIKESDVYNFENIKVKNRVYLTDNIYYTEGKEVENLEDLVMIMDEVNDNNKNLQSMVVRDNMDIKVSTQLSKDKTKYLLGDRYNKNVVIDNSSIECNENVLDELNDYKEVECIELKNQSTENLSGLINLLNDKYSLKILFDDEKHSQQEIAEIYKLVDEMDSDKPVTMRVRENIYTYNREGISHTPIIKTVEDYLDLDQIEY